LSSIDYLRLPEVFGILKTNLRTRPMAFTERVMSHPAKMAHNWVAFHLLHLRPHNSSLTRLIKKAAGHSISPGVASGKLLDAVGAKEHFPPGTPASKATTLKRKYIKWTRGGFSHGANLPKYTKYLEEGWGPLKYTKKQAAYMTYKIVEAMGEKADPGSSRKKMKLRNLSRGKKHGKAERVMRPKRKPREGRPKDITKTQARDVVKQSKDGFNKGLFFKLLNGTHESPPRPFQYLTSEEATRVAGSLKQSLNVEIAKTIDDLGVK